MKKLFLTFLLATTACFTQAQTLTQAEKLYQEGDFASAQKQYEQLLSTTTQDEHYQVQLRLAACRYSQGEYLNAAKTMLAYPLPENPVWKARFLLYRIQMAEQASSIYKPILEERAIENNQDPAYWTHTQWNDQIEHDYEQLWQLRNHLIHAPITQETLLFNLKDADVRRIPTLFDFATYQWVQWLKHTQPVLPLQTPRTYLDGTATPFKADTNRANKLADILQTAYSLEGTNRQDARLFWQTDFIILPFEQRNLFEIANEKKALKLATEQLNILSGYTASNRLWQKVKGTLTTAGQYGKTYAAYHAARLLWDQEEGTQALAICEYAIKTFGKSYYRTQCQELAQQITQPEISFAPLPQALHPQKPQLTLTVRNIPQLYARIYPVTRAELEKFYHNKPYNRSLGEWEDLTRLYDKDIEEILSSAKTYQTAQAEVAYPKPYLSTEHTFTLPALKPGLYVLLACEDDSFATAQHTVAATVINITNLALFTTAGINDNPEKYVRTLSAQGSTFTPQLFRIYTLDLKTGQPLPHTSLDIITDWKGAHERTETNNTGLATLARTIQVSRNANNSHRIDVWAAQGDSVAFSAQSTHFYFHPNTPVRLFIQTDRAIYRPGQRVYVSVQGFESTPRAMRVLAGKQVEIKVRSNVNGKQIFQTSGTLNDFGTLQTEFTLPEGDEIALGDFSVNATTRPAAETFHAYHSFSVEEYKRPEYEISLQEPTAPLAYHKKATVSGKATYYTGTPLQKATVKYTVTRKEYVPPFYWWYRPSVHSAELIAQGETTTNQQGEFSISWQPEPTRKDETATQYTVHAEVYDETGRAIDTSRTYKINTYARLFKIDLAQGFYDTDKPAPLADVTLTNADGQPVTGTAVARVSRVQDTPNPQKDTTSLDEWYKNAKDTTIVFTKSLTFTSPGTQTLQLPALPEGIYRLTLKAQQAQDQAVIFVVVAPKSLLKLPQVTLPQYKTYHPGETARLLIGSSALATTKEVEVYRKGQFVAATAQLQGGVSIYEYTVTEQDRGGLGIGWFGASDYTFYHGDTTLTVPFDNQELTVSVQTPETVKPGQQVPWKLMAKNAHNAPINGQASVSIYDKSLDYYAQARPPFTLSSLFDQQAQAPHLIFSRLPNNNLEVFSGTRPSFWEVFPQIPSLDLQMQRRYYRNTSTYGTTKMALAAAAPMMKGRAVAEEALESVEFSADVATDDMANQVTSMDGAVTAGSGSAEQPLAIRTNFAETAYFNSLLPVKNGVARFTFTFPQSVTTWNILGFAITQDAHVGNFTASTITRKDFMVRLHLPRFYREKDQGILQASVMNLTTRKLTVPVTISVTQGQQNKTSAFGISAPTQNITVAPNSTAFAQWNVTLPPSPGLYQVTASAHSTTDSDGEQRTLPIFPSLARLLASAHVTLQNGTNTLSITELNDVNDAQAELAALTLNPSLALSVLNSMPNLLCYPYKDLISSLNRYVPLAIVHTFYNTYPQLKQAVKKLPKRTGVTAPWDEQDPLRLTMLEQTPWLQLATGNTQHSGEIISLFDDTLVSKRLTQEKANVLKFQNANGSFSWFVGGPEDTYLTLRALEAFSQAVQFGAEVPEAHVKKALSYIVPKIEHQLTDDTTGSVGTVSYALYAAYTLSAFPANWSETAAARPYIKKWVDYADQQARFMTPLGQIYAAAVYHRLGDDIKANAYLDKVLARMKYNPLTGAYFAPEAQSWLWYQDTITTQTATLKTLLEIRPDSDKIDPMVQWLLFNRQVTSWQNPAAAAKAVFALLDVMKAKGVLSSTTTYQINWAGTQAKQTFEPFDWTQDLQWVKQGKQLTPSVFQASVTKQGKMTDFASLNVIYTSAQAKASPKGVLNVEREYFVRFTQEGTQKLRPVKNGDTIKVGDEVEVHLTLTADSAFEYVHLTDPKPAGFESADLHSRWMWNPLSLYQEVRDADTNFFINRLPAGKVVLRYVLRPTVPGKFHAKPAQIQSMYAPEYGAHSAAETVDVNH